MHRREPRASCRQRNPPSSLRSWGRSSHETLSVSPVATGPETTPRVLVSARRPASGSETSSHGVASHREQRAAVSEMCRFPPAAPPVGGIHGEIDSALADTPYGRNRGDEPARSGARARRRGGPGPQGARVAGPLLPGLRGGELRDEICTRRIEELSAELASLEARRSELAEEISESQPSVPDPAEVAELVGDIERALRGGACRNGRL